MRAQTLLVIAAAVATPLAPAAAQGFVPPAAITAEGVPAIPLALADAVRPYFEYRTAAFQDWDPANRGRLVTTRFGNAAQVHSIAAPGSARQQRSFEVEPIADAKLSSGGKTLLVTKDVGGGEFFQLYTLADGRLTLLTDGKSRNTGAAWSRDGRQVGFTSTRRNGTDGDLWLVDPADPKSARMLAQVSGGGWAFADFSPDGKSALVNHNQSVEKSDLYSIDLASGVPVYRQLIEQVRNGILFRSLRPGDQLPTVRQTAVDLSINPNTVVSAYRELDQIVSEFVARAVAADFQIEDILTRL